jgi:hypothetical protein
MEGCGTHGIEVSGLRTLSHTWQQTHTRMQFLEACLSAFKPPPRSSSACVGEESVEITLFGRPGLWALVPTWQQTHTGVQFLDVGLSAFALLSTLPLWDLEAVETLL